MGSDQYDWHPFRMENMDMSRHRGKIMWKHNEMLTDKLTRKALEEVIWDLLATRIVRK